MNAAQEAAFEKRVEKEFKSHRELPPGRNFMWNREKEPEAEKNYRDNFDRVFPNAPGCGF